MKRRSFLTLWVMAILAGESLLLATSFLHLNPNDDLALSGAVFRGTVVHVQPYEDATGKIHTLSLVRVLEVFKGNVPPVVKLGHRGGILGDKAEVDSFSPQFRLGEERLFFVSRRADGTLHATHGHTSALPMAEAATQTWLQNLRTETVASVIAGEDVTDQAGSLPSYALAGQTTNDIPVPKTSSLATNLLSGNDNIPARFLAPDRGEPIPFLIDVDYLPAGMTTNQATNAVMAALSAWTNVTSLRYKFMGFQSFGMAAADVNAADGYLRLQLHDHYSYLGGGGGDTLGIGGQSWSIVSNSAGWTTGGNVAGNDFHKVVRGYVVLQHASPAMQVLSTFTEVLTHEIGHSIGLAHSSENFSEPNQFLQQAIMYFQVHADGRGAAPTNWDINVVRQIHPTTNTPPYAYDRVLDIVTSPTRPLNIAGVNSLVTRGYDLQTTNLTFATNDATSNNGTFSQTSSNIIYVPSGFYSDSPRSDPAGNSYYDLIYGRFSDGVNASPPIRIRVVSYSADSYSEGIPNSWRSAYFGNANPNVGSLHHANDDADGDGYSNLQEFLLGSNPTNKNSNLRITSFGTTNLQWQAKAYELYELQGSTNLSNWTRAMNPVLATNATPTLPGFTNATAKQFFRLLKTP